MENKIMISRIYLVTPVNQHDVIILCHIIIEFAKIIKNQCKYL